MSLLELRDLRTEIRTRHASVTPVDGISFDIRDGETVGLVGESGSGKSMIGNSIMRLLPPGGAITSGQIRLDGRDLVPLDDAEIRKVRGSDIGLVFQDPMSALNPTMTIGRQIAETVCFHRGVSMSAGLARAREMLELVSVPKASERVADYPHQLSGGLRQRVVIAMALACSPKLLIADEPTTALDVTIQAQILTLLDDLKTQLRMALLLITHDMGVIAERADRVVVIYAGREVESAATGELFSRIRHPYTEALLASIPRLDEDRSRRLYSIPGSPPDLTRLPPGCRFAPRCRFATDRCRTEDPQVSGDEEAHAYACFHPLPTGNGHPPTLQPPAGTRVGAASPDGAGSRASAATVAPQPAAAGAKPGPEPPVILDLRNVSKLFPVTTGAVIQRRTGTVQAVSDLSLAVAQGETFGLVGESGCGKTTIGRIAATLDKPSSGQVIFDDVDLAKQREARLRRFRRDIQLVFQDPYSSLDPRMRVGSIIREPLAWQHIGTRAQQRQRVLELLDQVGLPERAVGSYPHEFSGGQRQRIALARALALNPRLIIADEPVSALDVSIRSQVLNLMMDLQAQYGLTYVVISHDLSAVRHVADRIGVMYLGKLVELGTGDDVYAHAAHPYTAGLLESIPIPEPGAGNAHRRAAIRGELPSAVNPPSGCRFRMRCPLAQQLCADEEPPLRPFGGRHFAACHFPLATPMQVTGQAPAADPDTPPGG
jgi:peptide/nickel transport system ATP-binding protein